MGRWAFATLVVLVLSTRSSPAAEQPRTTVYFGPIDHRVFIGADHDMPIGDEFLLSIMPRRLPSGEFIVPDSLRAVLEELNGALPHWYLVALRNSGLDKECSVQVNDVAYWVAIYDWMERHWNLSSEQSPLSQELSDLGITSRLWKSAALQAGLCGLVKSENIDIALEAITAYRGAN